MKFLRLGIVVVVLCAGILVLLFSGPLTHTVRAVAPATAPLHEVASFDLPGPKGQRFDFSLLITMTITCSRHISVPVSFT